MKFNNLKIIIDYIIILNTIILSKINNKNIPFRFSFESKKDRECVILGNGPSLNVDIVNLDKINDTIDVYVVNYFARSAYFELIKPTKYFFSDKMFWSDNLIDIVRSDNEIIFKILANVDWDIDIYCPTEAYDFINKKLANNEYLNIKIIPIRYSNLLNEKSTLNAIKNRFYSVPNVNSVITLLWYTMFMNYKKITILGSDFSAFKEFSVDQNTNEVIVATKHFYGNSLAEKDSSKKYLNQINKSLSTRLYQVYRGFKLLDILSNISKELDTEVINGSSFSYIDSFPRS